MKILVIIGDCILTNSSANLCHTAYIQGLVNAGHSVTLLSADGKDYTLDQSVAIPPEVIQYTYYGVSLYEKLSLRKKSCYCRVGNLFFYNEHSSWGPCCI